MEARALVDQVLLVVPAVSGPERFVCTDVPEGRALAAFTSETRLRAFVESRGEGGLRALPTLVVVRLSAVLKEVSQAELDGLVVDPGAAAETRVSRPVALALLADLAPATGRFTPVAALPYDRTGSG